ncbi:hypothetical protein LNTAR_11936 [Lentisphaera araneosa HTCC2155]|uniref:Uncharacterized protein n=2 Tax=Lentisphaera TaxID=256846 RepID=A6DJI8_9BACT|nr:hypothetical protein LNTAR_11936 [Lentisphaera araneosa HTCC2155]
MNQQKQIFFAFALYHEDNNGYFPVGKDEDDDVSWDDLLGAYDGRNLTEADMNASSFQEDDNLNKAYQLYQCPSNIQYFDETRVLKSYSVSRHFNNDRSVLGVMSFTNHDGDTSTPKVAWSLKLTEINKPSRFISMTEFQNQWNQLGNGGTQGTFTLGYITEKYGPTNADSTHGLDGGIKGFFPHDPKNYKLNYLHGDGHVSTRSFPNTLSHPERFFDGNNYPNQYIIDTAWNAARE